ncbi:hypothetical protein LTR53_014939 [Teratosphaeriaceae sp. CCFEE 6253]|nr:hypothetical protein LTR53_014939 [Teratosphaeriaceae sp. CCFEE 6253]
MNSFSEHSGSSNGQPVSHDQSASHVSSPDNAKRQRESSLSEARKRQKQTNGEDDEPGEGEIRGSTESSSTTTGLPVLEISESPGSFHHKKFSKCKFPTQEERKSVIAGIRHRSDISSPYELIPPSCRGDLPKHPRNASSRLLDGLSTLSNAVGNDIAWSLRLVSSAVRERTDEADASLRIVDMEVANQRALVGYLRNVNAAGEHEGELVPPFTLPTNPRSRQIGEATRATPSPYSSGLDPLDDPYRGRARCDSMKRRDADLGLHQDSKATDPTPLDDGSSLGQPTISVQSVEGRQDQRAVVPPAISARPAPSATTTMDSATDGQTTLPFVRRDTAFLSAMRSIEKGGNSWQQKQG